MTNPELHDEAMQSVAGGRAPCVTETSITTVFADVGRPSTITQTGRPVSRYASSKAYSREYVEDCFAPRTTQMPAACLPQQNGMTRTGSDLQMFEKSSSGFEDEKGLYARRFLRARNVLKEGSFSGSFVSPRAVMVVAFGTVTTIGVRSSGIAPLRRLCGTRTSHEEIFRTP